MLQQFTITRRLLCIAIVADQQGTHNSIISWHRILWGLNQSFYYNYTLCKQIFFFLRRLQTISVLMVALNILYLLVDETAMPKGSTVSLPSNWNAFLQTPTHTHTHTQNVNCRRAVLSDVPRSWRRHKSNSGCAQKHVGPTRPNQMLIRPCPCASAFVLEAHWKSFHSSVQIQWGRYVSTVCE